ncbi:MAG: hypothetical protein ARM1_0198 [Candidatus Micrarchaeota archaeon]|nr:MAG: hypothetical protein ARM1_0198 [Candidatus Micrarchaeota archaeon]
MPISESELIENELKLRLIRIDNSSIVSRRSLIRLLALSLGIINPGESRQSIIPIIDAIIYIQFNMKRYPVVDDIKAYINERWNININIKTLYYHLLKLKELGFIESEKGQYFIKPPLNGDPYNIKDCIRYYLDRNINEIKMQIDNLLDNIKNA